MVCLYHLEPRYSFPRMGLQNCVHCDVTPGSPDLNPGSLSYWLCDLEQQFHFTVLICKMGMVTMIILSTEKDVVGIR